MSQKTPDAQTRAAMAGARALATTREFNETVAVRVQNDPAFAQALLDEAIALFVDGEPESARRVGLPPPPRTGPPVRTAHEPRHGAPCARLARLG